MPVVLEKRGAGWGRVTYFCEFCLRQSRIDIPKRFLKTAFAWFTLPKPHSFIMRDIGTFDLRSMDERAASRFSSICLPTVSFPVSRKRRSRSVRETPRLSATSWGPIPFVAFSAMNFMARSMRTVAGAGGRVDSRSTMRFTAPQQIVRAAAPLRDETIFSARSAALEPSPSESNSMLDICGEDVVQ